MSKPSKPRSTKLAKQETAWALKCVVVTCLIVAVSASGADRMLVLLLNIFLVPALLGGAVAMALHFRRAGVYPWGAFTVGLASAVLCISVSMTQWPLHMSFAMAEPELKRIAARFEAGDELKMPHRAGVFVIKEVKKNRALVELITSSSDTGDEGFVYGDLSQPVRNPWDEVELGPRWRFWRED